MKTLKEVDKQLAKLGHHNRYLARAEVHELTHILADDEEMLAVVTGRYQNGFALLVATNWRILLIDKKPLFLNLEDTRYDMVSEVDYSNYFMDAVVNIRTINKVLTFKSIRQRKLRVMASLIQQKVMELRQNQQNMQPAPLLPSQDQPALPPVGYNAPAPQQPQPQNGYVLPAQPNQQSATDLGAMALNQPQTNPGYFSPYPAQPLTIHRRVSRFYPTPGTRY